MGKEEPGVVLELIQEAAQSGKWLCLKNLHLVTHWLDALEKEIQQLKPHQDFRLWLTSEPHDGFPIILAETCLKIAYEVRTKISRSSVGSLWYFTKGLSLLILGPGRAKEEPPKDLHQLVPGVCDPRTECAPNAGSLCAGLFPCSCPRASDVHSTRLEQIL